MKLKGKFEVISVGDDIMAVPIGENSKEHQCVIRLNSSASEIFEMLQDEISEEKIIGNLSEKYDNSKDEITLFVKEILKEFYKKGIVENYD